MNPYVADMPSDPDVMRPRTVLWRLVSLDDWAAFFERTLRRADRASPISPLPVPMSSLSAARAIALWGPMWVCAVSFRNSTLSISLVFPAPFSP